MSPILSIVIPVFNSADCSQELVKRIAESPDMPPYEIILVNDGSSDNSWGEITTMCNRDKSITGISLKKNSGQDNAIMAGLQFVKGDYVVIMDDDLQHDPKDIPVLYHKCQEGYELCYGLFAKKKQKPWKNLGSAINDKLSEITLSKPKGIYLSPFKVFRATLIKEMLRYKGPLPYVDALLLSATKNITQIPVAHHPRYKGSGHFNFVKSTRVFLNHALGHSTYPLRLIVYLAVIIICFSFIFSIYTFIRLLTGTNITGMALILLVIVFLGSMLLCCLAIIGEYIAKAFFTIKQNRPYLIDQMINSKK